MSRSGYCEDGESDNPVCLLWPSIIRRAVNGKRGQAFLKEMLAALDAMPEKKLIEAELHDPQTGSVCAIGSVGLKRGVDMSKLDPEDALGIAKAFGIAPTLVREIEYINDDDFTWGDVSPEARWERVRKWVASQIKAEPTGER